MTVGAHLSVRLNQDDHLDFASAVKARSPSEHLQSPFEIPLEIRLAQIPGAHSDGIAEGSDVASCGSAAPLVGQACEIHVGYAIEVANTQGPSFVVQIRGSRMKMVAEQPRA
jgi:hypothetical protein